MKKLLALFLVLVIAFSSAACSSAGSSAKESSSAASESGPKTDVPASTEETSAPKDGETVVIEFSGVESDWRDEWDDVKAKFENEYPWIEVQAVNIEYTSDFISTRAAAGDLPDVVMLSGTQTSLAYVEEGRLKDLSDRPIASHMSDSYLNHFTHNGQLWGITRGAAFGVMYYNMDILQQAGWNKCPENWDELIQCCSDIKEKTGISPIAVSGKKGTPMWFIVELIIANTLGDELGQGTYETLFKDGQFNFTEYPIIAEKLEQIQPYFLEGCATMSEDDVTAAMTDGIAAMAIAGNWTASALIDGLTECTGSSDLVAASLIPFNDPGKQVWATVSPEDGFCLSVDGTEAEQEAAEIFFDWLFTPENFQMVQNARGTVPVMDNMTDDQILLSDQIKSCVPALNAAPFITMGFNLFTSEFKEAAYTAMKDYLSGNITTDSLISIFWETEQQYYYNK